MALQKGAKVEYTGLPAWRKELRTLSSVRFPRCQVSLVRYSTGFKTIKGRKGNKKGIDEKRGLKTLRNVIKELRNSLMSGGRKL